MLLMRPELDEWRPGEEAGIHQGNNLSFAAATELLSYWTAGQVARDVSLCEATMSDALSTLAARFPERNVRIRGGGAVWGIDFGRPAAAVVVSAWAFERGLLVEPAWIRNDVLLVTPPLAIKPDVLQTGLTLLTEVAAAFLNH
jgi:diaminobutyrate-2-oxoglutarate transaminase